ncbi:hypothetical protein PCASD_23531 [Puccinia coronata f. sp. avenae]|uniref:Small nuclear ribonucleoprotein Prp3 C-terminal domain-containing protein n=2 Tax=Puccinia coronata f. sp. avenae TaxID=200324 RepID=A0A2N5S120_9BASI|nr:hypothetical protein PCASD_23531 [Puccinia coronata f. sp. avenae]
MANCISQEGESEMELLQSMYPDGQFQWIVTPAVCSQPDQLPSFQLSLTPMFGDGHEHQVEMRVTIGAAYPSGGMPKVQLRMESMGREDSESFRAGYAAWLAEEESERRASKKAQGEVCMDVVVGKLVELAAGFTPSKSTAAPVVVPVLPPGHSSSPIIRNLDYQDHHASNRTLPMAWSVFWMHHIKATGKRKNIVGWARELGIRGWSKPGYPGALVIDGPQAAVEEYSARLKALRWKAIQQRHLEVYTVPLLGSGADEGVHTDHPLHSHDPHLESHRKIRRVAVGALHAGGHPVVEESPPLDTVVEVQSMSHLLQLARAAGMEDELLQILKIK